MRQISLEKINNKNIFTVLDVPQNQTNKIVIMSHGFRGSNLGPARGFVDFSKILVEKGYNVLRFDQPNSGNSDGDFLDSSFEEWINTTAYFAKKYLELGFKVCLLGQSMGATVSLLATTREELKDKIPCLILWVPGIPDFEKYKIESEKVYEENGQKYRGIFWNEEKNYDFFKTLQDYKGKVHLVYGETDKYVSQHLREKAIQIVKDKGETAKILPGQDHSSWDYDLTQEIYLEELEFLESNLIS